MINGYDLLARVYDRLMDEINYADWARYVSEVIERFGTGKDGVCELGCGTGLLTEELAKLGYDMIGVDISEDMLSEAQNRLAGTGTLLLKQDMRSLDLYGTVDAMVCCMDGMNHLTGDGDLELAISRAVLFLNQGGIFAFDVNSEYRYENVYAYNDFVLEGDGAVCCWRNNYIAESGICEFYLTVFEETSDGCYTREDGVIVERCYSRSAIESALAKAGLRTVAVHGGTDFSPITPSSEKLFYIAKKI